MAVMTRANSTDVIEVHNVRKTLEFAKPKLVYPQFGQPDMILRRKSDQATWIRFNKLAIPENPLDDEPTFTPETVTDEKVTAQLEFWGNGVKLVEFLEETSFLNLPDEYKELLGQNAGETVNAKVRDILKAGTYAQYPNGKTSRSQLISTDVADLDVFIDAATQMESLDAPTIGDEYVCVISPFVKGRLLKNSAFRDAVRYQKDSMFTGELANIDGIRFVRTSTAPTVTNSGSASSVSTVDQSILLGKGAYGIARLMPGDFQVVVTAPGGHGDEFKVKTAMTWKSYLKAVILDQTRIRRIETAR